MFVDAMDHTLATLLFPHAFSKSVGDQSLHTHFIAYWNWIIYIIIIIYIYHSTWVRVRLAYSNSSLSPVLPEILHGASWQVAVPGIASCSWAAARWASFRWSRSLNGRNICSTSMMQAVVLGAEVACLRHTFYELCDFVLGDLVPILLFG